MKVLFVIAATVSCLGLAMQHDTKAPGSEEQFSNAVVLAEEVEAPVMDVLLDTVVITAVAPHAVAANVR